MNKSESAWSPSVERLSRASTTLSEAWHAFADGLPIDDPEHALAGPLLAAAGELVSLGRGDLVVVPERLRSSVGVWVERTIAMSSIELDSLEDAAFAIVEGLASRREVDDEMAIAHRAEDLVDALQTRTNVEMILVGAEHLAGHRVSLSPESESLVLSFDELVRPLLWKLTAYNETRAIEIEKLCPTIRDRFWWWSDGVGVPASAIDSLPAVALLIARFPEARDLLDRMIDAQITWRSSGPARSTESSRADAAARPNDAEPAANKVIAFSAWARRRARSARGDSGGDEQAESTLAMAAAPLDDEVMLLDGDDIQISLRARETLVVDVIADREDSLPTLTIADGRTLTLQAVPGAIERFAATLDGAALDADWLEVSVSLVTGARKLRLPPDSHS